MSGPEQAAPVTPAQAASSRADVARAVRETIGTASVCWNPMDCTGEFDERQANRIADELIGVIDRYAEAAAQAARKDLVARVGQLRTELADAVGKLLAASADRDDYAARLRATDESWTRLATERDELRALLGEILGVFWAKPDGHYAWAPQAAIIDWRNRAGIDAPAVVTAGTGHLAEKIRELAIPDED